VAGGAHLLVDLKAALERCLIEQAEMAFVRPSLGFELPCALRGKGASGNAERQGAAKE
jgi:hypothetical protein